MGHQVLNISETLQPLRNITQPNDSQLISYSYQIALSPHLCVSQTVSFALNNLPVSHIPLINNIIRNAKNVVGASELSVNQGLSSQKASLICISMINNADLVLREEQKIIFILALPDILEFGVLVEERTADMSYLPLFIINNKIILPQSAKYDLPMSKEAPRERIFLSIDILLHLDPQFRVDLLRIERPYLELLIVPTASCNVILEINSSDNRIMLLCRSTDEVNSILLSLFIALCVDLLVVQQISEILLLLAFAFGGPVMEAVAVVIESLQSLFVLFLCGFFIDLQFLEGVLVGEVEGFLIGIVPKCFFDYL